jgi:hypothetical protein
MNIDTNTTPKPFILPDSQDHHVHTTRINDVFLMHLLGIPVPVIGSCTVLDMDGKPAPAFQAFNVLNRNDGLRWSVVLVNKPAIVAVQQTSNSSINLNLNPFGPPFGVPLQQINFTESQILYVQTPSADMLRNYTTYRLSLAAANQAPTLVA